MISLAYVHVADCPAHEAMAQKFVASYHRFPPGADHQTIIVGQLRHPSAPMTRLFQTLPGCQLYVHDDSGHDIGGYIAVAKVLALDAKPNDLMLCCGGSAFFQRNNWLARMVDSCLKHGPGVYGSNSTYEVSPHLNTTGFWCNPKLLSEYPVKVVTRRQRYDFEHGPNAFWKLAYAKGIPVKLVAWTGEYDWRDWRKPPNIFRRGDQSNCLTYWHHHIDYAQASERTKRIMQRNTDTLLDPLWAARRNNQVSPKQQERLEALSVAFFSRQHAFA